jgi:NAD(P)-dependent dehydrogenase (short-subunit alcohol dehydrogenase family)
LHSEDQAQATADELRRGGTPVFLYQADLRDPDAITGLFSEIDRLPHVLGVLVNSAGEMHPGDPRTLGVEDWDATLELNLRAPFLCSQAAARRMTQGGLIVNITDVAARKSWSRFAAYSVSKAGLESLTRILARTYAPGIRVNAIAPGLILRSVETPDEEWARLTNRVPLARAGTPDELGAALEFLLHNDYVTGETLVVDGGYSLIG